MKKLSIVLFSIGLLISSLCADTYTWIAGEGGDWSIAANWEPTGVPTAKDDIATFTNSVTIAPSPSFCGTIAVPANLTVTASYASAARFTIAVTDGGRFEKYGAGEVIIHPADGFYYGDIAVMEGKASFAGNGLYGAPGVFGVLEVAPGATARVIESPYETRHSLVSYGVFDSRAEAAKTAEYDSYADLQSKWNSFVTNEAACKYNQIIYGMTNSFTTAPIGRYLPDEMYADTNKLYSVVVKTILVMESSMARRWLVYDGYGSSYYYAGSTTRRATSLSATTELSLRTGFIPFAFGGGSDGRGRYEVRFTMDASLPSPLTKENVFTHGSTWNGVCFGGLSLPEGARLEVANGQAVGFAFVERPLLEGELIAEGSNSCIALMQSSLPVDIVKFNDFCGILELGVLVKAYASEDIDEVKYKLTGDGEIFANGKAIESIFSNEFYGKVNVREGESFTSTADLSSDVTFTGKGTVIVEEGAPKPSADFEGNIKLVGQQEFASVGSEINMLEGLTLGSGGTLTYNLSALQQYGYRLEIPSFASNWTLTGSATTNEQADVLTLTTAASQASQAYFNAYPAERLDAWTCNFTYHATPVDESDSLHGDGFAFLLRSTWASQPSIRLVDTSKRPYIILESGLFGFGLTYINGTRKGFQWYAGGYPGNGRGATFEMMEGIDFFEPIDFTVKYARGIMRVTLRQGDVYYEFKNDFTYMYTTADMQPRYLGFVGTTDTAAKGRLAQTISNISGHYYIQNASAPRDFRNEFALTNTNWSLFMSASWTNENGSFAIDLVDNAASNTAGRAICKSSIPLIQPFTLSYDLIVDEFTGTAYTYSYITTTLQNLGLEAGELPSSGITAVGPRPDGRVLPDIANSVSTYFMPYLQSSSPALGFRTTPKSYLSQYKVDKTMNYSTSRHTYKYELIHDGNGTLVASCPYLTRNPTATRSFTELTKDNIGTNFYLMLGGFNGYYSPDKSFARVIRIGSLKMSYLKNQAPRFSIPIGFEGNGTLSLGSVGDPEINDAVSFDDVRLVDGVTLTVSPYLASVGTSAAMGVSLNMKSTLIADTDTTITLHTIKQTGTLPATLTLQGRFKLADEGLTVVIPSTCYNKRGFVLLDTLSADMLSEVDTSKIRFVDENGKPVKRFYAKVVDGAIYAWFAGPSMFMIQ